MKISKKSRQAQPRSRSRSLSKSDINPFLVPQWEYNLYHQLVDHIGDEVMILDGQGTIVFANIAAVRGLGYPKSRLINQNITKFFKQKISVRQWQKTYFTQIKKKKKPVSFVLDRVVKGKKIRTIDVTVVWMPYKSADYVLSVGRDITEQIAFQKKLQESEDRYRLLSEQAADGIVMVNPLGITIYANQAAARILKTSPHCLIGKHFEKFIEKAALPKIQQYFRKVTKGERIFQKKVNIRDDNGKLVPVEITASPIVRDGKVIQIHVLFRDASQKRKMEALVLESEKIQSLQNFITGTMHEIQQPLKGLMDHSQSLIDRYQDRHFEYIGYKEFKDIMKTLQTMNDQVRYCFETTERLTGINRRKAKLQGNFCNVNQVIRDTVNMLKHSFEVSEIKIKKTLPAHLPHAAINVLDLSQVLSNVLTNSIQALPGNRGTIQIKTSYLKSKDVIRIDCRDDGVGVPRDVISRVFDPFFTTKLRGLEKSSGLGLYIVYSIIQTHKGEVTIKSDLRKGTIITILLPAYKVKHSKR